MLGDLELSGVVIVDYVIGIPLLDYILVGVWAQAQCLCRVDFPDLPHGQTVNVRRAATRRSNPLWDRPVYASA
jgi:hypothetical protein